MTIHLIVRMNDWIIKNISILLTLHSVVVNIFSQLGDPGYDGAGSVVDEVALLGDVGDDVGGVLAEPLHLTDEVAQDDDVDIFQSLNLLIFSSIYQLDWSNKSVRERHF